MLFGPESLNLQELERRRREFLQQFVTFVAAAARFDLLQDCGEAFADARDIGDFAFRIGENG